MNAEEFNVKYLLSTLSLETSRDDKHFSIIEPTPTIKLINSNYFAVCLQLIHCQTPRISFSISELTANSALLELQDTVENVTGIPPAQHICRYRRKAPERHGPLGCGQTLLVTNLSITSRSTRCWRWRLASSAFVYLGAMLMF